MKGWIIRVGRGKRAALIIPAAKMKPILPGCVLFLILLKMVLPPGLEPRTKH